MKIAMNQRSEDLFIYKSDDEEINKYLPNVNAIEEMTNMISASRSYQSNIEVMNTSKQLLIRTLSLGQ